LLGRSASGSSVTPIGVILRARVASKYLAVIGDQPSRYA
jgi:hypothetical protein